MELRPGYKQTEVGVIPKEWAVKPIRELLREGPKNGLSARCSDDGRGTLTLSLAATSSGHLILNDMTVKHLEQKIPVNSPLFLEPGDVLVQRSNTADLVGTTAVFEDHAGTFVYPDLMMRLRFKEPVTGYWFWRYANSDKGRSFFRRSSAGSTGSMPKISGETLRGMLVPVPAIDEQQIIVDALHDADALIESLESLIAKKRALKQGTMQELLSGRRRLPGFKVEWSAQKFGVLATIRNEKLNTYETAQAEFCVELEHIGHGTGELLGYSDARQRNSVKYLFRKGDVLFGKLRPYLEKYWSAERDGVCSTEIWPLIPRGGTLAPTFLAQIVKTDAFVEAASSSYGTHMPRSDWKALADYEVMVPPDTDEQIAIASLLTNMDDEVAALEARLLKSRQIKQGMMQELLTGRVRLL